MFGCLIPKSYKEALEFDKENNNTKLTEVCIFLQGVPPTGGEGETMVTP